MLNRIKNSWWYDMDDNQQFIMSCVLGVMITPFVIFAQEFVFHVSHYVTPWLGIIW